jgi:acetyl esterase/lipase
MKFRLILALLPSLLQAQPSVPDWVSIEPNVAYSTHPRTVLDVYQSRRTAPSVRRPAVIVIHGGGWVGGKKENMFNRHCLPYLEKGFVVFNVEYRLASAALAPAAVEDVLLAAKWVRANASRYHVDRRRIVVTGDSAGGHLALMVGLTPKQAKLGPPAKVAAVINFYGITDVQDQLEGEHMRTYATTWVPATLPDQQEIARRVSPYTWVRKKLPPVLTIHGDADPVVPYEHGVDITKELMKHGNSAELLPIDEGDHGNFTPAQYSAIFAAIFEFLARRKIL